MEKQPIGGCPLCGFFFYEPWEVCDCYSKQVIETETMPTVNTLPVAPTWPFFVTGISWLRTKEDKGIGDTVKHALSYMGGTQFEWVMKRLGVDCGCGGRQEWLNAVYPYTRGSTS